MTRATFTCDHGGAQVGLRDDRCPSCSKVFDAVRCPKCGHQGPPQAFTDGCPKCRYLAAPSRTPKSRTKLFTPAMAVILILLAAAITLAWALRSG